MPEGACAPARFLSLVRDFVVFEDDGGGALAKKMAGYHQFHAVGTAVAETLRAAELQKAGAVVGREKRLALIARDIVEHFETRLEAMDGKAMVVCMSRRICVDLCARSCTCGRSGTTRTTTRVVSRW